MTWRALPCVLVLAVGAAPAYAQVPAPTPVDVVDDATGPGEPEETPDPRDPCAGRGPGTDGDYVYCDCPPDGSADADYIYGCILPSEAPRERRPRPEVLPTAPLRPVAARSLPRTGEDARVVALIGLGFVMSGAGLRLVLRPVAPRR